MTPEEFNKEAVIAKKCELERSLNQTLVGGYSLGSLIAHHLDNLYIKNEAKKPLEDKLKEAVVLLLNVFKAKSTTQLEPLIVLCWDKNDQRISLLMEPITRELKAANIPNGYYSAKDFFKFISFGSVFFAVFELLRNFFQISRAFGILGELVKWRWSFKVATYLQLFLQLALTEGIFRVFKKSNVEKLLVDWDRGPYQKAAVLAAGKLGAENQTLVHGTITIPTKFVPLIAKECLCWGKSQMDFFQKYGEDGSKLKVVGFPKFKDPSPEDSFRIKTEFKLSDNQKVLLYIDKGDKTIDNLIVRDGLKKCVGELEEEWIVFIKPHPSASFEILNEIFVVESNMHVLPKYFEAVEALSVADLVLIVDSSFTFDALLYGRPVIFYDPRGYGIHGIVEEFVTNANALVFFDGQEMGQYLQANVDKTIAELSRFKEMSAYLSNICAYYGKESAQKVKAFLLEEKINT